MRNVVVLGALIMSTLAASPQEVSFPAKDGGVVYADIYGAGDRGLVLAHGARFNKGSWAKQAGEFARAGFRVAALDFRGYGQSRGGPKSQSVHDEMYMDVLAAVAWLRANGAKTVAVLGASMGGGAAANAVAKGGPGEIDRLVLLAHAAIEEPERVTGPKLFITAELDPVTPRVREQYNQAPDPKELVILDGAAHAQFLFTTDQADRLMREILRFLSAASAPSN